MHYFIYALLLFFKPPSLLYRAHPHPSLPTRQASDLITNVQRPTGRVVVVGGGVYGGTGAVTGLVGGCVSVGIRVRAWLCETKKSTDTRQSR